MPFKLRVSETTRAEREGRAGKSKGQVSSDEVAAEDREADEGEEDDEDDEEGAACRPMATILDLVCTFLCSVQPNQAALQNLRSAHAAMMHVCMQLYFSYACAV